MGGKYSVLIEGETLAQLKSAVAEIHDELQGIGGLPTAEAPKSAAKVTEEPLKKASAKKAKEEPPVEKEAEPEADIFGAEEAAAEKEEEPPPAKTYTKSQVKEVLQKVITKLGDKGIKEGVKILGTFGVKSLTALPEDKYAAFVAACEKVL